MGKIFSKPSKAKKNFKTLETDETIKREISLPFEDKEIIRCFLLVLKKKKKSENTENGRKVLSFSIGRQVLSSFFLYFYFNDRIEFFV